MSENENRVKLRLLKTQELTSKSIKYKKYDNYCDFVLKTIVEEYIYRIGK